MARFGTRGVVDGLLNGGVIGVPPIFNYGTPELQAEVLPDILDGKKFVALAISEAFAGSDVSGLQTSAVKDGDHWVITGTKKYDLFSYFLSNYKQPANHLFRRWITNGTWADYFTTGCKTEVSPAKYAVRAAADYAFPKTGFTMILIPRGEGVETKPIKTSYSAAAGTAYVTFDKVRVPIGNTLGKEGAGMSVILSNFNHERWMVTATSLSAQRVVVEECLKYVLI